MDSQLPVNDDRAAKLKRYYDLAKESGDDEKRLKALKAMKELKQATMGGSPEQQPQQPEQGFLGKAADFAVDTVKGAGNALVGGLEAGATIASGVGAEPVAGLAGIAAAPFVGAENAGDVVNKVREWGTYQPQTQKGQEYISNVGGALEPVGRELEGTEKMLGDAAMNLTGSPAVAAAASAVPTALMEGMGLAGAKAATKVRPGTMIEGAEVSAQPSSTLMAESGSKTASGSSDLSVGAAQTPKELERAAVSKGLPVPFDGDSALTKGQVTRNFEQLQFEKETAKLGDEGAPLRSRVENQTETLISNLDAYADMSQPMRYELRDIGQSIDQALIGRRDRMQARVNGLYERARDAGELRSPVKMGTIPEMLSDIQRFEGVAPNATAIRREALRLGAVVDNDGVLSPGRMTIDDAELFRQFVNASTDIADPRESRIRRIAVSAIDDATETAGGDLYREARTARSKMMGEFENAGITRKLLSTKKGTTERGIAYEDAFKKIFLDSPIEEINKVRSSLLRSGDEGKQAWADLKARGINYIKENAQSASQLDSRGNPLLSVDKLNRAISSLDEKGKLSSIYGKRSAQAIRDLGDMSKYIYTAPPGAINHSNTASAIMVALDSLGTFAVTGVPAPVVSVIRSGTKYVKNVRLRKKINESLDYLSENAGSSSSTPRGS